MHTLFPLRTIDKSRSVWFSFLVHLITLNKHNRSDDLQKFIKIGSCLIFYPLSIHPVAFQLVSCMTATTINAFESSEQQKICLHFCKHESLILCLKLWSWLVANPTLLFHLKVLQNLHPSKPCADILFKNKTKSKRKWLIDLSVKVICASPEELVNCITKWVCFHVSYLGSN